jgi:hypothetical protein
MRSEIVFALALLAAVPLDAGGVSDLRTVLTRLPGRDPLTASIEMTRSRHAKGRFMNDDFEGSAAAQVDDDASSLRITVAHSLLDRSAQDGAVAKAVAELVPSSVAALVDFAPVLAVMLVHAQVIERAGRTIVFALPPATDPDGDVTFHEDRLTITIGADGVPVSARRVRKGSAGFLFIRIDTVRSESWDFAVHGDHLLATRADDLSVVSGPMQSGRAQTIWTIRGIK